MIHKTQSELAGTKVKINPKANEIGGQEIHIEDWFDRVLGKSWMDAEGNWAAMGYAVRTGFSKEIDIPINNEVLYGKIGGMGYLVHIDELVNS
jgi:hypothetical protein